MRLVPLAVILCAGCMGKVDVDAVPKRDAGPILRVVGRFSVAHACPASPTLAFTNAHVTDIRPFDPNIQAYPMMYSDGDGRTGTVFPVALDRARDLAFVQGQPAFVRFYERATEAPKIGDRVWFIGYDWSSKSKAFATETVETVVNRVIAGHLILRDPGGPGSSGSCVLDDSGRLVAINAWGRLVGFNDEVGVAVGVWGNLGLLPESASN